MNEKNIKFIKYNTYYMVCAQVCGNVRKIGKDVRECALVCGNVRKIGKNVRNVRECAEVHAKFFVRFAHNKIFGHVRNPK